MPSHSVLANALKTSVKTVHDALKVLIDRGILLPRRGRYGTSVIKLPNSSASSFKPETSIFASAQETAFYHYEKIQNKIKKIMSYIAKQQKLCKEQRPFMTYADYIRDCENLAENYNMGHIYNLSNKAI